MNMDEYSESSATSRVTSNNNKDNNNHIVTRYDYDKTEEYEPTDPDNFYEKITKIASWTHNDLAHNTVLGVQTFMTYWDLHSYCWYCYCNQQLVSTGTDTWEWECPTCKYLEASQGDNEAHWDFGVHGHCNNIGPADVTCVTCLLNQGNKNTYAALIKVMKMYRDEPTLLHSREFVILANYYYYLHEQCQEVDTWNRLKWHEYYENPYAAIQSHPLKMVTWKCPNQYCNRPEGDWKNVQKICPYCLQVPPACIKWLVDHSPSKMFSHVFAIKGSPKTEDGKWVEVDAWLREHHEEYDALYQQMDMEEEEHMEHQYQSKTGSNCPNPICPNEVLILRYLH
jgi:hypothetical protein